MNRPISVAVPKSDEPLFRRLAEAFAKDGFGTIQFSFYTEEEEIVRTVAGEDFYLAAFSSPAGLDLMHAVGEKYYGHAIDVRRHSVVAASPVVVGWRRDLARRLGLSPGWRELFEAAQQREFRLAHTSGAVPEGTVVLAALLEAGRRIGAGDVDAMVRGLEAKSATYAESDLALRDLIQRTQADAFVAQEHAALDVCRATENQYVLTMPSEGTFLVQRPIALAVAGRIDEERAARDSAGLDRVAAFINTGTGAAVLDASGYRGPTGASPPSSAASFYVAPSKPLPPYWKFPTASGLGRARSSWGGLKRGASVILVVDVSGSMSDESKLGAARRALLKFLDSVEGSDDRVGLVTFGDKAQMEVPLERLPGCLSALRAAIRSLSTRGSTPLLDAVVIAVRELGKAPLNGQRSIVLLTDGDENASKITLDETLAEFRRVGGIIAYGIAYTGAGRTLLERLASATGGEVVDSQPDSVLQVYEKLSRRF